MRGHSISIVVGYRISVTIIIFIRIIIFGFDGLVLPVWRHLSLVLSSFVTGM